jgi:hypothetical protein
VADGVGLENRYWETNRGFESHVLRHISAERRLASLRAASPLIVFG